MKYYLLRYRSICAGIALVSFGWIGAVYAQSNALTYLKQGWSDIDRNMYYTTSQGSQLMPYDWFLALERPNGETLFRADSLTRFGYLPNLDKKNNPDLLPVGFVKNIGDNSDWVGMNCSACHTNQFKFAGKTLQVDGGPSDADLWALISEIGEALAQTSASQSDAKFKRFANRVLTASHSQADELRLYKYLKEFSDEYGKFLDSSKHNVAWGRARTDAFGMIFNRATAIDLGDWRNAHSPNAPVSYPFLWDTHWHDVVQWNGAAPNMLEIERLARNVGEVLGVFAHVEIKKTFVPPLYFKSSVKRVNQIALERKLSRLRSPEWPRDLAAIDTRKAAMGAKLYKDHCVSCHAIAPPHNKPLTPMKVTMTPLTEVGTDPLMATNARNLRSRSGILEGVRMPPLISEPIPAEGPSFELVGKIVVGAILAPPDWDELPGELDASSRGLLTSIKNGHAQAGGHIGLSTVKSKIESGAKSKLWIEAKNLLEKNKSSVNELAYKARPLNGIWATAPYLHNGSVPNLYQLLLPSKDRIKKFFIGTREFDPINVGFATDQRDGAFEFDTSLPGNSNAGHDKYGTDALTDEQRWQLVEYLKTL